MKYTTEIIIDCPLQDTIEKMKDPENMKHWQRGLTNYEILSGHPGEEGTQTKLNYDFGKRKMTLIETIIKNKLPHEVLATYDAKGVHNIQHNFFEETPEGQTIWTSKAEFQFAGWGMKAMGFLMPGAFKKQSLQYMIDFKSFAENGNSVRAE